MFGIFYVHKKDKFHDTKPNEPLSSLSNARAVCVVGYYDEDVYDRVLEIDGSSEYVAFTAAVGKKPDIILDP